VRSGRLDGDKKYQTHPFIRVAKRGAKRLINPLKRLEALARVQIGAGKGFPVLRVGFNLEPQGMDSFEFNKIAGAVLGTLLFLMGLGLFSDGLFSHAPLKAAGYDLPGASEEHAHGGTAEHAAPSEPLPVLLAAADAKRGEALVKPCATCHSFDKGGAAKVGPPLYGVVTRKMASLDFGYSEALKGKGGAWDFESLNSFITAPSTYVKGTKMAFGGEKDAKKRADILAYLRSLSDAPAALPAK
jgi:cytochrome c